MRRFEGWGGTSARRARTSPFDGLGTAPSIRGFAATPAEAERRPSRDENEFPSFPDPEVAHPLLKMHVIYVFGGCLMRLTVQTVYALRMLMHLSCHSGALVTIHEIAERYGISKNHLMKVAHSLRRAGFVETNRGGGLRLSKPAKAILVGAVARRMEQGSALVECFPGAERDAWSRRCCVPPSLAHHAVPDGRIPHD